MTGRNDAAIAAARPEAAPATKMLYLIRRKPTTTREELIAHWFANHMPMVIQAQQALSARKKPCARRYIVTLYDPNGRNECPWDGVAQLWWEEPLPMPETPHGVTPTDTFQQKVLPYLPWATREYVVIDGSGYLEAEPLTLNDPFPCTRSGFYKVTFLVRARPGINHDRFYSHWLTVHIPRVEAVMEQVGGFRYVVSHSISFRTEPYAGMAELYFHDKTAWAAYKENIVPDGMEEWVDSGGTLVLTSGTEMVGLP